MFITLQKNTSSELFCEISNLLLCLQNYCVKSVTITVTMLMYLIWQSTKTILYFDISKKDKQLLSLCDFSKYEYDVTLIYCMEVTL